MSKGLGTAVLTMLFITLAACGQGGEVVEAADEDADEDQAVDDEDGVNDAGPTVDGVIDDYEQLDSDDQEVVNDALGLGSVDDVAELEDQISDLQEERDALAAEFDEVAEAQAELEDQAPEDGDMIAAVDVLSTTPDAWEQIQAENQFNDPPEEGRQFYIAEVILRNDGDESISPFDYDFEAYGDEGVTYSEAGNSCGVIPNELFEETSDLRPGGEISGNVCWEIRSADADSLTLEVSSWGFGEGASVEFDLAGY